MRRLIPTVIALILPISAHAQGMTPAQQAVTPIIGEYLDCGYLESTLYAAMLPDETPENIVIAMNMKCRDQYNAGKAAVEANFNSTEAKGILETVDDEFMRRVISNVIETRVSVQRAKGQTQ